MIVFCSNHRVRYHRISDAVASWPLRHTSSPMRANHYLWKKGEQKKSKIRLQCQILLTAQETKIYAAVHRHATKGLRVVVHIESQQNALHNLLRGVAEWIQNRSMTNLVESSMALFHVFVAVWSSTHFGRTKPLVKISPFRAQLARITEGKWMDRSITSVRGNHQKYKCGKQGF